MGNRFAIMTERTAATPENTADEAFYEYYRDHRGFDAFAPIGEWQTQTADLIVRCMGLEPGDEVLDLGCAGGANVEALLRVGIAAHGVDISRYLIEETPHAQGCLVCAPADDLSAFNDGEFDLVYSQQVFEHVAEVRCATMLQEIRRVLRKGGLLFAGFVVCAEDADDIPARPLEGDDPTHINVQPMSWWHALARRWGFERVASREDAVRCHPWFREHPFDFAVWRKF